MFLFICTMAASAAAHITAVTPVQIPYGHATSITVNVADATPATQLALVPGGAFPSGEIVLPQTLFVFPLSGRTEVLAGSAHALVRAETGGESPRVAAQLPLTAAAQFFSANAEFAVVLDAEALLHIIDLRQPGNLQELARLRVAGQVRDLALDQHTAFVLLASGQVLTSDVAQASPGLHVLGNLSADSERLIVEHGVCYSTTPAAGLSISACGANGIEMRGKFAGSGVIHDLRIAGNIAYLAGGPAGLTLVDVTDSTQPRLLGSHNKLGDVVHVAVGAGRALASNQRGDLVLLDISRPALPLLISKSRTRAAPQAIAWNDGDAWLATKDGAQRIDFHAEAAPLISDEGVNLGGSRRGFINDNILYVADWFSGLHLYDISDANNLRHIGNFHTPGSSKGVVVHDGVAFVGDDDHGVQIIDVSDPAKPALLSNIPTPGLAYTMKLVGSLLYIADHRGGLHIADVGDVRAPHILGSYDTPGKAWAVDVRGPYAFVADDASGLLIFDVGDPHRPRLAGQYNPGGAAEDVRLRGNYAFVTFFDQGLVILDITVPAAPSVVGKIAIPGNARGVDLQGDFAYVAAWEAGLQIIDVSDPARPRIAGYYDTDGSAWGVNVRGEHAYVLDWWGGVKSVDIRAPQTPKLAARYHARAPIRDVALMPHYALTAADTAGLQIFDITNPLNPVWVTGVELPAAATRVAYADNTGYVATAAGIAVIDLHDPFNARLSRIFNMRHAPVLVRATGRRVFVLDDTGRVFELDPARGDLIAVADAATDIWIDAATLYVARGAHGFALYTLADGQPPQPGKTFSTSAPLAAVRAQGNLIVAALRDNSLAVLTRHGDAVELRGIYPPAGELRDFQLIDNTLYLDTAQDELLVLDLTDAAQPVLHARYSGTHAIGRFAVHDDQVFFAGETKLASLKLLPEVHFVRATPTTFTATVPANEPLGSYDLAVMEGSAPLSTRHDALHVTLKTGKKLDLSPQQFQRLLEQQKSLHNGTP